MCETAGLGAFSRQIQAQRARRIARQAPFLSIRLVVIGTVNADNGQPLLTILDLRPYEKGFLVDDMQKVNIAYTKKNPENFIRSSEIVYAD